MSYAFTLVDVFTDRPFGGNQLAVFPDAHDIADETMQRLAREFNFSESTFVVPPRDPENTCRVRIFTPHEELPFAGHPTVGTAAALANLRGGGDHEFVFEEGIGPVAVTVDGTTIRLRLRAPDYQAPPETPPAPAIAKALGLAADDLADCWYGGVGLRFCFVRLATPELVDRAKIDKTAWQAGVAGGWASELYVFSGDDHLHARFLAPGIGIDEDPATGSACASLVAGLAHRAPEADGTFRVLIDQGVAMGRPSKLEGTATKANGVLTEVVVSGQATIVGNGTMTLAG